MLTASILAVAASLSVSHVDFVTILRRGDIPLSGSGVIRVWIEFEVRHSAGTTSKMYLTYFGTSQMIPDPGDACTVMYKTGLVDDEIEGINHQLVESPINEASIIEELSCRKN